MHTNDTTVQQERTMTPEESKAALAAARQEIAELQDKYLRAAAALENARKQADRDATQRANQRIRNFSMRLLEVADNLERMLAYASKADPLRPGAEAALQQLQTALRQEGVTPIAVQAGGAFDPQIHEAITTQEGDVDHATAAKIIQTGYMQDGQLLRPVRVEVTVPKRTDR